MSEPIRIMVVDDHVLLCDSLAAVLDAEVDMQVTARATDGEQAVAEAARAQPDIVLMDIDMPGSDAFDASRRIEQVAPQARLVFLSGYRRDTFIERALQTPAWGYLLKWGSVAEIINAIRRVNQGAVCIAPEVQARLIADPSVRRSGGQSGGTSGGRLGWDPSARTRLSRLTQREREVLVHLASGRTRREIAEMMQIADRTVAAHVSSIMGKLEIRDRVALAKFAISEGLSEL